jgi:NAD(P)-dependent dehydrogenase (short-subunit alcohol dehydrogenase family)
MAAQVGGKQQTIPSQLTQQPQLLASLLLSSTSEIYHIMRSGLYLAFAMPSLSFNPDKDIPSLAGKVILVTGGTAGLGKETVLSFAGHEPAHIFFTGRSQPSADKVIEEAKAKHPGTPVTFVKCDLASFASVKEAAKTILSQTDRLDIAMMNAGVMALPPGLTKEGYEIQFGTNHMGHALLLTLLTPLLETTASKPDADVRVVWNTSLGYQGHTAGGIHFDKLKTTQCDIPPMGLMAKWFRYGQSKLANLLYARAYAKHHPNITSVSIHPGVSATGLVTGLGLFDRMFVYGTNIATMIPAEQCARNQQWAATAPKGKVVSGKYYEPVGAEKVPVREGSNDELAEKLYEWTEKELEGWSLE